MYEILQIAKKIQLLNEDVKEIDEYLQYNEWGIAFEILCSSIEQNNMVISNEQYQIISQLGERMEMDEELWAGLKRI